MSNDLLAGILVILIGLYLALCIREAYNLRKLERKYLEAEALLKELATFKRIAQLDVPITTTVEDPPHVQIVERRQQREP